MVRIGVDQIVFPYLDIGRIDTPDEHARAGKVLVPLNALAVLDDEVFTLVGSVHAVTRIALFKGGHSDGTLALDEDGLRKAKGIPLKQAVARGVAAVVVLETAGHDGPGHGMRKVGTTAANAIGVVEVGQSQAMAELVADGANASNIIIIDIELILFTRHVGRAGI